MGFSLEVALRYMTSKKRAFISVGTMFAILGVALGTAALATVLSVTGGFRAQFREKVLGVNAHVLVLKYSSEFPEYREVMQKVEQVPEVVGAGPFVINPMMVTHKKHTATGVLLKGVDPERAPQVLDLPRHMILGSLEGLRRPGAKPPERPLPLVVTTTGTHEPESRDPKPKSLLDALRESTNKEKSTPSTDAENAPAPLDPDSEGEPTLEIPSGAPIGNIEPAGGYESVLPDDDALPDSVNPDPCAGDTSMLAGAIIGVTLQKNLDVKLGDCIQVTSPTIGYSYSNGVIRPPVAKQFRVTGVFEAGFDQYDSKLAYTDLYEAQAFYDGGDTVTGVEMKVKDIDRAKDVAEKIDQLLEAKGLYHTMDWEELNHGLFTALRIQQILMSLVLALIILVAAFTVIATLIMVVLDKKKEIAVIKAMGATDLALLLAFLYQGLIIGIIGAALGLGFGFAVCKWIVEYGFPLDPKVYFISKLPVQMSAQNFSLTFLFAVLVCVLATMWPALHAARLRPAEAFRER